MFSFIKKTQVRNGNIMLNRKDRRKKCQKRIVLLNQSHIVEHIMSVGKRSQSGLMQKAGEKQTRSGRVVSFL